MLCDKPFYTVQTMHTCPRRATLVIVNRSRAESLITEYDHFMQRGFRMNKHISRRPRVVLVGGGTAGHIIPNLALKPHLVAAGFDVFYFGSTNRLDRQLADKYGIPFYAIKAGKYRRHWTVQNLFEWTYTLYGLIQSLLLLAKIRPNIVFSKGAYMSVPVVVVAWCLRVPVIIHESDVTPGLANRLCSLFASEICVAHAITKMFFHHKRINVTGIPLRDNVFDGCAEEGFRLCGLARGKPVVLVIGGTAGAENLNKAVADSLDDLLRDFQVVHVTGLGKTIGVHRPGYTQFDFTDQIGHLYAMADIVVSRAGATTLMELLALKKICILIPLSRSATRGDQVENARYYESEGVVVMIEERDLQGDVLATTIRRTLCSAAILNMKLSGLRVQNGVVNVTQIICRFQNQY